MSQFFMYVLLQGSNLLYRLYGRFGKRIATHNVGKGAKYTASENSVCFTLKNLSHKAGGDEGGSGIQKFSVPKRKHFYRRLQTVDRPVIIYLEGEKPS